MNGCWVPHDTRDEIVDYVRSWKNKTEIPAKTIVRWIGISPAKYFDWKKRYGKTNEHNGWIPRDHWLTEGEKQAIIKFHFEHPLDGYRRLTYRMLDENVVAASPASVYRVLNEAGLIGKRKNKPTQKGKGFAQPSCPHRHWHVDISYLNIAGTFYYMCSVLDGYSRFIVHWEIRESMAEADVEIVLQRAKELYPDERPRIITDNGPQFIAKDFKHFIRISGMTHVRTSPYYPQSNGKIERYHRSIKSECIRPKTPLTIDDARRLVAEFIHTYNHQRLHSAIGYITPKDKMLGREQEIFAARDAKLEAARKARQEQQQSLRTKMQHQQSKDQLQHTCYTENARPEDRAMLGSNPSAVSGPKTKCEVVAKVTTSLPHLVTQART